MKKIYLAFLWHQHQPIYKNPLNDIYELPWVRLHAIKDYYDMVAILDDFPKIKANINLVPSLLVQLEEYSKGIAKDLFMELTLKNADTLQADDKIFILKNFFMANFNNMIAPNPRYLQLFQSCGNISDENELKKKISDFKTEDFRDLQTWFNLAWMDPYWIKNDELIKSLYNKGSYFTEEEKVALIQKHIEICGKILSKHKEAQDRGQIEISVSPFYHPIIPLLCDTDSARQASPSISLPNRFVHPEDAAWQINSAVEYYEAIFGKKPQGMWPSEGSVSNEAVSIMAKAGIKWIATDEAVLYRSKYNVENTMQPNRTPFKLIINGQDLGLNIVFRNTNLSDSIGFVYSKWNAEDAANDFMNKLYSMRDNFKDDSAPLINVILDGENCWEYYKNDGWNFLTALYNKISADDSIETVRLSDYIKRFPTKNTVNDLTAGSWIYANFSIWIGHSEDNESWNRLNETRQFLTDYIDKNPSFKGSPEEKEAWENIYIAEGSDWNWWYGSEHHGANDAMFDFLFRQRLVKVYNCLGKNADVALYSPIKHLDFKNTEIIKTPSSFISPKINGKTGDYFKWKNAGYYKAGRLGGSMHQVSSIIDSFYYGFDFNNFYIRIDLGYKISLDILKTLSFNVIFISPVNNRISASFNDKGFASKITLIKEKTEKAIQVENAVYQDVAELKIPFRLLNLPENYKEAMFFITVDKDNMEVDRCPYKDNVLLPKPENKLFYANWNV